MTTRQLIEYKRANQLRKGVILDKLHNAPKQERHYWAKCVIQNGKNHTKSLLSYLN